MKNIIFVVGTRPNFMKVAPILHEIRKNYATEIKPILIHTGQHYDVNMSDIFFEQLNILLKPVCFNIYPGTPAQQICEIMNKFEIFLQTAPKIDIVVVVGDVTSSLAAALAAIKANIPIAHVEAGLRSFDKTMPEEINRIIIDSLSTLFFTTEPSADENLESESHTENVYRVGNVMIDTLITKLSESRKLKAYEKYGLKKEEYVLATIHRISNINNKKRLISILQAIEKVSHKYKVLFLAHPGTQKKIKQFKIEVKGIIFEKSVGYLENLSLIENARLIVTDSGGIQEEAAFLGTSCVTLRKSTERPITVSCGTNIVAGEDEELYEQIISCALSKVPVKNNKIHLWDGNASERIMKILSKKI